MLVAEIRGGGKKSRRLVQEYQSDTWMSMFVEMWLMSCGPPWISGDQAQPMQPSGSLDRLASTFAG
jgi:hypothetical protein